MKIINRLVKKSNDYTDETKKSIYKQRLKSPRASGITDNIEESPTSVINTLLVNKANEYQLEST